MKTPHYQQKALLSRDKIQKSSLLISIASLSYKRKSVLYFEHKNYMKKDLSKA